VSVLAFDVGGTDVKAALVGVDDAGGTARTVLRSPTPLAGEQTPALVIAEVARLAAELRARHPEATPAAAGLVVPGVVDEERGLGVWSENLGWRDAPLRAMAQDALGLPVAFGHDVVAGGLAERQLGAAAGYDDVAIVTVGTGIAAALVVGGRPHRGGGLAGEIGHAPVAGSDEPCACGRRGCLEATASAAAIARRYGASTGTGVSGARDVLARATAGDAVAHAIWDSAVAALAFSFTHLVAVLAPEAIVVGGGLAQAGPALFEPLGSQLAASLTFQRMPALLPARVGEDAGVLGAALMARELAR
jgi:glucokinase